MAYIEKEVPKNIKKIKKKVCTGCGTEKVLDDFSIDRRLKDGVCRKAQCRECRGKGKKKWDKINKKRLVKYREFWEEKNPDYRRKYRKENSDKIKKISHRYYENNKGKPQCRITSRISKAVCKSLKGNKQGRSWESMVGYTCAELRQHLEGLFLPGMSWDNMGEWHIDHKVPVSAFNFQTHTDIDFKECWALTNLQPMWAVDNVRKGSKLFKPHQPALLL